MTESVGESPLRDTRFKPGVSGNPGGRPKGAKNKPRSKMRSTLEKLYTVQEDAIEIIKQELTGKNSEGETVKAPPKAKVDIAKFVIKAIESYNNTCLREESLILGVQEKGNSEGARALEENQEEDGPPALPPGFSLDMEDDTTTH